MRTAPERGIVITTAELASEGVERVLETVAATGANAITMPSSIAVEASQETGLREPPLDVAGENRALDRPLWGKRVTYLRRYVAHPPDSALWADLPWDPPSLAPESQRTDWARQAIEAARERGLRVHLQLTPYQLPGTTGGQDGTVTSNVDNFREEYRPKRLVGGSHPDGIAYTGCLNHPTVRALGRTRMRELLRHYSDADGISMDWVEYPVYFLEKVFTCFCEHCERQAIALGYDWSQILDASRLLWDSLHTIRPELLEALVNSGGDWGELIPDPEHTQQGLESWMRFKTDTVRLAIADLRTTMADAGAGGLHLSASGFSLPWGRMSGAAWPPANGPLNSQRVKLYSFHWLMMVRWWGYAGLQWNKGSSITEEGMIRAILALFDLHLQQEPATMTPEQFGMPMPDEGHNLEPASYHHRLENTVARWGEQAPLMPLVHAYRSPDDFALVLDAIRPYTGQGVWVQRYGYLSDEKMEILRQEWQ